MIGTWMQDATLPWLVLQLTDSASQVGLLVFCRYSPFLVLGLFSGALADRFDNRRFLIWVQVGQLFIAAALAALAFSSDEAWPFFVLGTLGGVGTVFDAPSRQAFTSQLVARQDLPNAVALSSSVFSTGLLLGPAFGGVLIATVGAGWCFTINAMSFLILIVCLILVRPYHLFAIERGKRDQTALAAVQESLGYVWRSRRMRLVLALVAVMSLTGFNFRVVIPILAETTLDAGPQGFGFIFATFGAGSLVGGLLSATLGRARWRTLLLGAFVYNAALLGLAPVHNTPVAALLLFVVGASFTFWLTNAQSMLQLTAPDHLRGRVLSVFIFAWAGLAPVSALLAGWFSHQGGTQLALLVSGLTGMLAIGAALSRVLRGEERHTPSAPINESAPIA